MGPITIIRKAEKSDVEDIHRLVCELAVYEKAEDQVAVDVQQYQKDFTEGLFEAFVIEWNGKVIGTTIFYLTYSTWKGKMVYLEDFIISEPYRNRGFGRLLFHQFIDHCKEIGAKIVRWHVLDWNKLAIDFYKKYPVTFDDEWITVKWNL